MNDKMLDRIRKLMRLAADKGATQEEAESALLMAQKLMIEHGLAEEEVHETLDPQEVLIEECQIEDLGRTEAWRGQLAKVIAANFRCETYWEKRIPTPGRRFRHTLVLLGHAADTAVAKEVYLCAVEVALREVGLFLKERGRSGSRQDPEGRMMWNDFLAGFTVGLRAKYASQVKVNGWQLAVVTPEDVKRRLETLNLRSHSHRVSMGNIEAKMAGFEAGEKFEPRRKMKAAKTSTELAVRNEKGK